MITYKPITEPEKTFTCGFCEDRGWVFLHGFYHSFTAVWKNETKNVVRPVYFVESCGCLPIGNDEAVTLAHKQNEMFHGTSQSLVVKYGIFPGYIPPGCPRFITPIDIQGSVYNKHKNYVTDLVGLPPMTQLEYANA